ncbi:MAG TPA: hypothetical protein VIC85_03495 [Ktedonobacterales bacterium]|jgi:hypothetical protein
MDEPDESALGQLTPDLPADVAASLRARNLPADGETALRAALEAYVPGFCLYRLTPAAARRWRVRYRLMAGPNYYDGQSANEAYARALLAVAPAPPHH